MILAAGRGERMRPLSDTTPKPLLEAGGKPLIVWQIEALARAGFRDIVVNAAHLAERLVAALGDGAAFGVTLHWSLEPEPLEAAGGIATALPLLPPGPALIVSGDVFTTFDYASLRPRADAMAREPRPPRAPISCWSRIRPTTPAAISRWSTGRLALDGDAAAHVREHRPLRYRASSANFRAGRSSNCCPTSNGGLPKAGSPARLSTAPGRTSARRTTSRSSMPRCGTGAPRTHGVDA